MAAAKFGRKLLLKYWLKEAIAINQIKVFMVKPNLMKVIVRRNDFNLQKDINLMKKMHLQVEFAEN